MYEKTQNSRNQSGAAVPAPASDGLDRLAQSARSGIDAASNAVHPAIDRVASGALKAVDHADEVADQAAQALHKAGVKGEELAAAGTRYVREHPLITLGLVVGAGYVLSRLMAKH
jgi:ElaB/YqjD/DUF883 family membrane-anchored ribosome-binding protein